MRADAFHSRLADHQIYLRSVGRDGQKLCAHDEIFEGLDLTGCDLAEAELQGCRFVGCQLNRIVFYGAWLTSARFSGCALRGASFVKAKLDYVQFEDCDLEGASFFRADIFEGSFRCVNPASVDMRKAFIAGCRFDEGAPRQP